jgi:hypothetical protein
MYVYGLKGLSSLLFKLFIGFFYYGDAFLQILFFLLWAVIKAYFYPSKVIVGA